MCHCTMHPLWWIPFFTSIAAQNVIQVGLLFVDNVSSLEVTVGYRSSASAVLIAEDSIRAAGLMPGYTFNYSILFDNCEELRGLGLTEQLLSTGIDVIIGPTCNTPTIAASLLSAFYSVPLITWGLSSTSVLLDAARFPTTISVTPNMLSLSQAVLGVLTANGWDEFAFVYDAVGNAEKCPYMANDLQTALAEQKDVLMSFNHKMADISREAIMTTLDLVRQRARIVVMCFSEQTGYKRDVALAALDMGLLNDEFVFMFADSKSRGFDMQTVDGSITPLWAGTDGRDEDAKSAFRRILMISDMMNAALTSSNYSKFESDVIRRMADPPFNCRNCSNNKAAIFAGQLHDALFLYAIAYNRTSPSERKDGTAIKRNAVSLLNSKGERVGFDGYSGPVSINENGTRTPTFYLVGLDDSDSATIYASMFVDANKSRYTSVLPSTDLWRRWAAKQPPPFMPKCGFTGSRCPVDIVQTYLTYVVIAGVIGGLLILFLIFGVIYIIQSKRAALARENSLWQVPYGMLAKMGAGSKSKGSVSHRSLQSTRTTSTRFTMDSLIETKKVGFFTYHNEPVCGLKHDGAKQARLFTEEDESELRKMRQLDHDNVNKFIGMSLDAPVTMSIWRYCSRGSLQEVIAKGSLQIDAFFIISLMTDIVNGLSFLHNSFLSHHGRLTSALCLVDDRWQVKLSGWGMRSIGETQKRSKKDLLWTAPELLRCEDRVGSKKGDVYSLAIICSEIIGRCSAWDVENRKEKEEEIVYMVKRGGINPLRPSLVLGDSGDLNPAILHLIRDCWSESPEQRPAVDTVKSLMKNMHSGRATNLMDHVFSQLESYASNLEEEVEERMKELVEEKKKSDLLLYRMLPKQVADRLKLGQSVEPETYESVTIFFSDVVSFTTLASKCTPLQVVNLLNDLYTVFDGIIDEHDAYKVETIGDGYLIASGLPRRNGDEHIREICRLSLAFMKSLDYFRIPHLPRERIRIRIGINCGSVVTGVVGLTMPRYCIFGDTVNTASRMESNGKPGHIHLSWEANELLRRVGGFETEPRGEVIIKGKGVMETFWLVGEGEGRTRTAIDSKKAFAPLTPDSSTR